MVNNDQNQEFYNHQDDNQQNNQQDNQQDREDSIKRASKILISLLAIVAVTMGFFFGKIFYEKEIVYISQDEILELEKNRLAKLQKSEQLDNAGLFYGKPDQAIKLIDDAKKKEERDRKIVLISEKTIYGAKSISDKVHKYILNNLAKQK